MKEIEIKSRVEGPEELRRKILEAGGKLLEKKFEKNILLDFEDSGLSKEGKMIRLREREDKVLLTYKGPLEESAAKKREEIEVNVSDLDRALEIFGSIGLLPTLVYEKERELYSLGKAQVMIDRLPEIGYFCEIESVDEKYIEAVASKLGLKERSKDSYSDIIERYARERGGKITRLEFNA